MKKLTLWKLFLVMLALFVSVGSTIAYLTDSDGDVNIMTLGRVEIDLIEQERTANGLDIFHDDKPLIPGVYPHEAITGHENTFWPDTVHNTVDKIVSIDNTGNSHAYVRLWFAFEVTGEKDFFRKKIHLNRNDQDWNWHFIDGTLEQNGQRYVVATATYNQTLLPGQSTEDSLRQVLLASSATNEDLAALGEKYSILVVAQAVQAQGFSTSAQALDAGFGAVTLANHPFTGMETGESFVTVSADGLQRVLKNLPNNLNYQTAVTGVTFGRLSEYGHVVDPQSSQPVDEQSTSGLLPKLFATAYADDNGDVVAYYVPSSMDDNGNAQYHVYILSEGTIKLPKDCDELVGDFGSLEIFTATNLDASDVKHLQNFFKGCNNLTVVKVPEGVTIIPEDMFENCDKLEIIEFPESVEKVEINPQAFKDHKTNVYLIVVPGSQAEQWGDNADNVTTTNWPFTWWNMGDYIHITKYIGTDADVVVPAEIEGLPVEVLGSNAFYAMDHMDIVVSVQLPDTLRRADYGVFIDCNKLRSINIPASLQRIPQDFLAGCNSLESIIIPKGVIKLESGAFSGCSSLKTVSLPETVTYLGYDTFANCSNLESITFSKGLTHIGTNAFFGTRISALPLPNTVQWLGEAAFSGMWHLQEITIPASVTTMGANCIPQDNGLIILVQHDSAAQAYCEENALTYILSGSSSAVTPQPNQTPKPTAVPGANPSDADNYKFWPRDGYIYIDRYEDKGTPATQITVPGWLDGLPVRVIGTDAFAAKKFLQSVTLPEGLWEIKPTAFNSCERLTYVYIPDSVNNIGRDAFSYCGHLQSIRLPAGISSINDSTFAGCYALSEITIPSNVLRIEREAFANCSALQTVTLKEGLQTLAAKVFANCSNLRSITIPKSVTDIGRGVFDGCHLVQVTVYQNTAGHEYVVANGIPFRLLDKNGNVIAEPIATPTPAPTPEVTPEPGNNEDMQWFGPTDEIPFSWYKTSEYAVVTKYEGMGPDVVIPAELGGVPVKVLALNAFARMEYVKTVQLPETLTTIEGWVFPGCEYMTTCNIPAGVTSIGDGAFSGCNRLQSITIPKGITAILDSTFGWCEALTTVTIPGTVQRIDTMAFHDCHGLTKVIIENGVQFIGDQAFYENWNLTSIVIPSSVTDIGANIFKGADRVTVYCYQNTTAHQYCIKNNISFILLDVPEAPTPAPTAAPTSTPKPTATVTPAPTPIPSNVEIEASADIPYRWFHMGNHVEISRLCDESANITIPSSIAGLPVTVLRDSSFSWRQTAVNVVIPDTVTFIGERAFEGCDALKSVAIPSSVTKMEDWIFAGCNSVQVTVDAKNTAYDYCKENGIAYKLLNADGTVVEEVKPNTSDNGNDDGGDDGATYFAPTSELPFTWRMWGTASAELVKYDETSNANKTHVTVPDVLNGFPVRNLCPDLFSNSSLESIVVPLSVTWVSERAFANCTNLTSITFYNADVQFADDVAADLGGKGTKLTIYAPGNGNVEEWCTENKFVFTSLSTKHSDNNFEWREMEDHAEIIRYKGSDASVTIPSSLSGKPVTVIGNSAFNTCQILETLTIPSSVEHIADWAFAWCDKLHTIKFNVGLKTIGSSAFCGTDSLDNVVVPEGVTSIGDNAFNKADHPTTSLESVTLPASITHLGWGAFHSDPALTIHGSTEYIENWCKQNNVNFEKLYQ